MTRPINQQDLIFAGISGLVPPKQALSVPPSTASAGDVYDFAPVARPVIWDTDWWTDCDDVAAARVLVWAEKQGLLDVRAVGINANWLYSPASLDAVFRNDGRPDIVLAVPKTSHVPDGAPAYQRTLAVNYPNRGYTNSNLPDAVSVYRRVLANATRKVDIICVGYLNNLYELLNSPADAISPLTGSQLIAQSVGMTWIMGGQYPSGTENNFSRTAQSVTAAVGVCANWPTQITFLGAEVGNTVLSGQHMVITAPTDIVGNAYSLNGASGGRPSWDNMCTLLAAIGDPVAAGFTTVRGTNVVTPGSGANTFTPNPSGNHVYVVKAKADGWYAEQQNDLLLTATQPTPPAAGQIYQDGVWQALSMTSRKLGAAQPVLASRVTATVDVENLSFQIHASDCAEVGDGGSIVTITNRASKISFRIPATNAGMAVYKASIGGKPAIKAAANNYYVTEAFRQPVYMTVYAKIYFDVLPSGSPGNQTIVACDLNSGNGSRQWHTKVNGVGAAETAVFTQAQAGSTDDSASGLLTVSTWQTAVFRMDNTQMEALINGAGNGSTARTAPIAADTGQLSLFSRAPNASIDQLVGYLHELRIYHAYHSDAQVAAVMADMD